MRRIVTLSCLVASLWLPATSMAQLGQSDCSLARSEIDRDACYRSNRDNAQRNSTSRQRIEDSINRGGGSGSGSGSTVTPQEAERLEYWRKRTEKENAERDAKERAYRESDAYKIQQALLKKEVADRVWQRKQLFAAFPAPHRFATPVPATVRNTNQYSTMGEQEWVQNMLRQLFPDTAEHIIEHALPDFRDGKRFAACWPRDGTRGTILALLPAGYPFRRAALFRTECAGTDLYYFESLSTDTDASEALRIERADYAALLTSAGVPAAQHFPPEPELTALQKLEKRCNQDKDATACAGAARAYAQGDGTGKNPDMAGQFLLRACHSEQQLECGALSVFHYQSSGIERSMKKAHETAQAPCTQARQPEACAVLGSLYLHGLQVDRDYTLALSYLQTSCTGGQGLGCMGLGLMYEEGRGVVRDRSKARQSYDSACKAGFQDACRRLKNLQG